MSLSMGVNPLFELKREVHGRKIWLSILKVLFYHASKKPSTLFPPDTESQKKKQVGVSKLVVVGWHDSNTPKFVMVLVLRILLTFGAETNTLCFQTCFFFS